MKRKGGRDFRNNSKGHIEKTKEGSGIRGGRWEWLGLGGVGGGKRQTTVPEQQ